MSDRHRPSPPGPAGAAPHHRKEPAAPMTRTVDRAATPPGTTSARWTSSRRSSAWSPTAPCCTRWSPPSWPPPAPARSRPRPGPRSAAAAPSRSARRAPAGPARARSRSPSMSRRWRGPRARSRAATPSSTPKKMVRLALLLRPVRPGRHRAASPWSTTGSSRRPRPRTPSPRCAAQARAARVLVVLGQDELDAERSFANLPEVQTTTFGELTAYDVLRADWLVFTDATLPTGSRTSPGRTWSRTTRHTVVAERR